MDINIITYNCFSIRLRIDPIKEMLQDADILLLQEILLYEEDCNMLEQLHQDFDVVFVPSTTPDFFGEGRPIGGLALFYRTSLNIDISNIVKNNNFLAAICKIQDFSFAIFNIYMPVDDRSVDSLVSYQNVLGEIQFVLDNLQENNVLLAGDFNASFISNSRFWPSLDNFIEQNSLKIDDKNLPIDTFTYLHPAHSTVSFIDHIISSQNLNISAIEVLYNKAIYDHFPVKLILKIPIKIIETPIFYEKSNKAAHSYINWKQFSNKNVVEIYNRKVLEKMESLELCNDPSCTSDHTVQISSYYNKLKEAFLSATYDATRKKVYNFKPIPGWNEHCAQKYNCAKEALLAWIHNGKSRQGFFYENMVNTRKLFKNALKYCKYNQQQLRDEKLATNVLKKNPSAFWKEAKIELVSR